MWIRMRSQRSADQPETGGGRRLTVLCGYAIAFTVCSFAGWLYEVLLNLLVYGIYTDRGILHMPLCPIYGFFALFLMLVFRKHNGWLTVFFGSTMALTVLELLCSYPLEAWLGFRLWDYSAWPLHFEGRISLFSSLIFGVMSLLLVKGVQPLTGRFTEHAPAWLVRTLGLLGVGGIGVDFVLTVLERI